MIVLSQPNMTAADLLAQLQYLRDQGVSLEYTGVYVRNPAGDREPLEAVAFKSKELFLETHQDYVPGAMRCKLPVETEAQ